MPDTPKLKRLKDMQERLSLGKFTDQQKKDLRVADTDGRMVRLTDDDAADVIARRIAAEEAPVEVPTVESVSEPTLVAMPEMTV